MVPTKLDEFFEPCFAGVHLFPAPSVAVDDDGKHTTYRKKIKRNIRHFEWIVMKTPVTTDKTLGNRLTEFLEMKFPGESHASKSRKFGFPNTSVLEWENGRALPEDAYRKLLELGCDLQWLFTGDAAQKAPPANAGEALDLIPRLAGLAKTWAGIQNILNAQLTRAFGNPSDLDHMSRMFARILSLIESATESKRQTRHRSKNESA